MNKFSQQFLKETLSMSDEDVKLVMECQRKFPSILINEGKGFCVDGRRLHNELEVSKAYATWIKTNLENVDAVKEIDYEVFSFQGNNIKGGRPSVEYNLTLEIAKEICMVTGLNSKANEKFRRNSKMCRKYFIKLEQAIKGLREHIEVRNPEKESANVLTDIIEEYKAGKGLKTDGINAREFNMLNKALTGFTAADLKYHIGYQDNNTREHLKIDINKGLAKLQDLDIALWHSNMNFEQRKEIIENTCKAQYSYIKEMFQ